MLEGHDLDTYHSHALLTGVFNRLGDGKSKPLKCEPPAWTSKRKIDSTKAEIALARAAFEQYVGQRS